LTSSLLNISHSKHSIEEGTSACKESIAGKEEMRGVLIPASIFTSKIIFEINIVQKNTFGKQLFSI
jgi:hypothetical protein